MQRGNGSVDLNNDHGQQEGSLQKHWTSVSKPVLFTIKKREKKKKKKKKRKQMKKATRS